MGAKPMIREQIQYLIRSTEEAAFQANQDYRQAQTALDAAVTHFLTKYGETSDLGMMKARQDPRIADLIAERNLQIQLIIIYSNLTIMYSVMKVEDE